jgi:hypothetical protein
MKEERKGERKIMESYGDMRVTIRERELRPRYFMGE